MGRPIPGQLLGPATILLCYMGTSLHLQEFKRVAILHKTVSGIGLEFFSSLESGFPGALHLQSTVELVLQPPSHGRSM